MKDYKILFISFVFLIFMVGAVSATDGDNLLTSDIDDTVSISNDDVVISNEDNTKEIYVNDTGDDSNTGSAESPYATIGAAISNVTASDKATIYLSEGNFVSDNDVNLNIQLLHKNNGGSLAIIGAGADKTVIDGQSAFRFASTGWNANVTLKDITFVNFKQNTGAVISANGGILTIENCVFKDSYATGNQAGAIKMEYNNGVLTVRNSSFINCSVKGTSSYQAGGGAIHASSISNLNLEDNLFIGTNIAKGSGVAVYTNSKSYISGNKFINLTGTNDASVFTNDFSGSTICNNVFINCSNPSTTSSILNIAYGKCELRNNTFINSSNSLGSIYSTGTVSGLIVKMDDSVIDVGNAEINNGVPISVNITDDMGNIVKTSGFTINFVNENNTYTLSPSERNGKFYVNFESMPEVGIYNVTATCAGTTGDVLTTANVHYSNELVELYVSPEGSDADEGTLDAPFETIQHALDVGFEKTFNVTIHLLKGTYSGEGNVELVIANKGTLQIIGEKYGEAIIDGNEETWLLHISTESIIKNLKFINAMGFVVLGNEKVTLIDCIIDNNNAEGDFILYDVNMDNLTYTNNYGYIEIYQSLLINNSYFANNYNEWGSGGVFHVSSFDPVSIENCKFINNTAGESGGAIALDYAYHGFSSKNNYFEGNYAPNGGVIYSPGESAILRFENNTFVNNKAERNGIIGFEIEGYEVFMSPALIFNDCKFINNSAVNAAVTTLKIGIFNDCSFINNTADYGGVFIVLPYCSEPEEPVYINYDEEETITALELNNVVFENNVAKINGNDIYLREKYSWYWSDADEGYYQYIPLNITYNDLNVSSLVDDLTVNVVGPCGAIVGSADDISFEFDGKKIGSSKIVNGVATLSYAGFEDGEYVFSGSSFWPHSDTVTNPGKVIVKLENVIDHVEFWISPEGSDEDGNGSEANPFKSISYAVQEASKNSRDIIIHIGEGIYTGDLNTALGLSSMSNLTLAGAGIGKTVIDGENSTYFATIADGPNKVTISNLSIKNMLPDNRNTLAINSNAPITIIEGGNLVLDTVEMVDNHGGVAIIAVNGNLAIDNSQFRRNGFTAYGIISAALSGNNPKGGNVTINNSIFEDNYAIKSFIVVDNLLINNSEIKNIYLVFNSNQASFDLINIASYATSNTTILNTRISNDGSVDELNGLGVNTQGKLVNPALNINGGLYMNNCSVVNNFNGTLNGIVAVAWIYLPSVLGYAYGASKDVSVYNSSFINFQYLWMSNSGVFNFVFDGCSFEDFESIAYMRNANDFSSYNITNSAFVNCTPLVSLQHYMDQPVPTTFNFNDNYWGDNAPTTINFLRNAGIGEETYTPDTWIVLYSEDEKTIIKNVTDGENSTEYTGYAPIKVDYADNNGLLDYALVIGETGYLFETDEETNVIFNHEDAMHGFIAADPMNYRTPSYIIINGFEGDLIVVGMLVDPVGNPIANATITSIFADLDPVNTTTDENGIFKVKAGKDGVLVSSFAGDDTYFGVEGNLTFTNAGKTTKSFINLNTVDGLVISGNLVDDEGAAIANAKISYVINANKTGNTTTDANGVFSIQGESDAVIDIIFEGSETADAVNATITLKNLAPVRSASSIKAEDYTTSAIDYYAGERGGYFKVQLVDESGAPIANKTVKIGFNGVVYEKPTDENGWAQLQINLAGEGTYTFAVAFLGDDDYNASFVVQKIIVSKKKTSIDASAKSYKASAKTKSYTVTLKTDKGSSVDGKTYLKAGKKVTLKVNGKTYTAKTNAKGQATFKLSISKKGKYSASIKFEGDKTYAASSKTAKITIN